MNKIRLSKSVVGEMEKTALADVIDQAYLGMGSFVNIFEQDLKNYLDVEYVVCANSGTAALHLALMAIGLKPGDEVLVQSLTFISCFQAITASGAVPIACEILPVTITIDLSDAEKKLTPRTKAIMPVHYAGRPGDLDEIYKFAKNHGLRVIEDAAHAFGTIYKNKKIGSFGDIICFSFDGIKNITCGEGGAVVTHDEKVARFVMDARLLGVQKDTQKRYEGNRSWEFDVTHQGYRYHMSNLFAAIGIVQLKKLDKEFKTARQKVAKAYHKAFSGITDLKLFPDDYDVIIPHIFPVRVLNNKRDALRQYLLNNNIECGIHYYPNHLLTFYGGGKNKLPVTEQIYKELLSLPLHPEITDKNIELIVNMVKKGISLK